MKQVILEVEDDQYQFFKELVDRLSFVRMQEGNEGDSKEEIIANLKQGFQEMKLYREGKTKGTALKDFLDEL